MFGPSRTSSLWPLIDFILYNSFRGISAVYNPTSLRQNLNSNLYLHGILGAFSSKISRNLISSPLKRIFIPPLVTRSNFNKWVFGPIFHLKFLFPQSYRGHPVLQPCHQRGRGCVLRAASAPAHFRGACTGWRNARRTKHDFGRQI